MDALLTDILDQPRALREALRAHRGLAPLLGPGDRRRVVLAGMGASHFAAYPAFLSLLRRGAAAVWIEAGELLHFAPEALGPGTVAVLVSQSGRSAEIMRLLEARRGAALVGVTNDPDSPLGRAADVCVPMHAGPEQAGVATKTFTCSLLALDLLAGGAAQDWPGIADALEGVLERRGQWLPGLEAALGATAHVWALGRGAALAAALTCGLMLKEAGALHGEGLSVPQFRHGPLEAAGPGRSALLLTSPGALGRLDLELAAEMAEAGMGVAACTQPGQEAPPGVHGLPWPHPSPAVLVAAGQCLAHAAALRRGVRPGSFERVGKVTTRE